MASSIYEISLSGMSFEKARLAAATQNIAKANLVASSPAQLGNIHAVTAQGEANFLQAIQHQVVTVPNQAKAMYKPDHAAADANGFVYSLKVNVAEQMLTINSATRAYEANIKAFNAYKDMGAKALEIGK